VELHVLVPGQEVERVQHTDHLPLELGVVPAALLARLLASVGLLLAVDQKLQAGGVLQRLAQQLLALRLRVAG
jgi:hypothetical protein